MIFIRKFEFTYQDYLEYHKELLCLNEESENYTLDDKDEKGTGDKKHDKIFKEILQDKKEMAIFLDNFIGINIDSAELEIYNSNFITHDFKYKQADIIYKVKNKEIYYLVEHQTKVDYSMAYRILNYCIEIIRNVVRNKGLNRVSYEYPVVIPIVLYTGNNKWTAKTSFYECQTTERGIEDKFIDVNYKVIDINKYEMEELIKYETMLANIMILEKCKNNEDVVYYIKTLIRKQKNKVGIQKLKRIIAYLYENIDENNLKKILKLIEESESEETMSTIAERLKTEYYNMRIEGKKEIIKKMKKRNMPIEEIIELTNFTKEQIEKI